MAALKNSDSLEDLLNFDVDFDIDLNADETVEDSATSLLDFSSGIDDLGLDDLMAFSPTVAETSVSQPVLTISNVTPSASTTVNLLDMKMEDPGLVSTVQETLHEETPAATTSSSSKSIEKPVEIKEDPTQEGIDQEERDVFAPVKDTPSAAINSTTKASEVASATKDAPEPAVQTWARSLTFSKLITNWDTISETGPFQTIKREAENDTSSGSSDRLHSLCLQNGYIPHELRLSVWSKLLNLDTSSLKNKISDHPTSVLDASATKPVVHHAQLIEEVDTICSRLCQSEMFQEQEGQYQQQLKTQMEIIFTSFCRRRCIDYPPGLVTTFAPLFVFYQDDLTKDVEACAVTTTIISEMMFSMCSHLFPHLSLGIPTQVVAERRLPMLHMVLQYHEPALAHLLFGPERILDRSTERRGFFKDHMTILASFYEQLVSDISYRLILWDRTLLHYPLTPGYPVFIVIATLITIKSQLIQQQQQSLKFTSECIAQVFALPSSVCDLADLADTILSCTPRSILEKLSDAGSIAMDFGEEGEDVTKDTESVFCPVVCPEEIISSIALTSSSTIRYFVLDCRPKSQVLLNGLLPTALYFNPDKSSDPTAMLELLQTLQPLERAVHVCLVGETDAKDAVIKTLLQFFIHQHAYPFISVLGGGYAAMHEFFRASKMYSLEDLVDHKMDVCELCHGSIQPSSIVRAAVDSTSTSTKSMSSFSDVLKDGKSWLQKKKVEAEEKSETLKEKTHWLKKKTEELEFPESFVRPSLTSLSELRPSFSSHSPMVQAATSSGSRLLSKMNSLKTNMATTESVSLVNQDPTSSSGAEENEDETKEPQNPVTYRASLTSAQAHASAQAQAAASGFASSLTSFGMKYRESKMPASLSFIKPTSSRFRSAFSTGTTPTNTNSVSEEPRRAIKSPIFSRLTSGVNTLYSKQVEESSQDSNEKVNEKSAQSKEKSNSISSEHSEDEDEDFFTIDDDDDEDDDHALGLSEGEDYTTWEVFDDPAQVGKLTKNTVVLAEHIRSTFDHPLFFCVKKKQTENGKPQLLSRYLGISTGHVVCFRPWSKVSDERLVVKSVHHLSSLARMTCFKKNKQLVSLYYHPGGQEKGRLYQIQNRDAFITTIKGAMEKLVSSPTAGPKSVQS